MHSHLIPGIDDGAQTMDDSLRLIQGLLDLGYDKFITTPHVLHDVYPNSAETILSGAEAIQKKIGSTVIQAAAEYYLDAFILDVFSQEQVLLPLSNNLLLVEFGFVSPPIGLESMIRQLLGQGYQPVFAHPERYGYFHHDLNHWGRLKEMGCLLQCNLLSFSGYYGEPVRRAAERLADRKWVDFLGTDLHHDRHLAALQQLKLTPALKKVLDNGLKNSAL